MSNKQTGYRYVFQQKEYMKNTIASIMNRFGDSIDGIAFVWLVYEITHSAAWSAIVFGVNRIPTIFLQPLAGAVIEGTSKKNIMIISDITRALCVLFVAFSLIMRFTNQWIILIATIIISSAEAFRRPAETAFIPQILNKEYYEFGLSLNASVCSITELIGLGIAGIIISVFSITAAIYMDIAAFLISALVLFTLPIQEDKSKQSKFAVKEYGTCLKEGFLYMKDKHLLIYYVILCVFLNGILVPYNSLQAPIISEVLHAKPIMLSVLGTALSAGMILGAYVYPYISNRFHHQFLIKIGISMIGFFYFIIVIAGLHIHSVHLLYITIFLVSFMFGFAIAIINSVCNIELIKHVDEGFLARVSALAGAATVSAIPLVSLIVSLLINILSTDVILIISGTLSIVICLCICNKWVYNKAAAGGFPDKAQNNSIEDGRKKEL